MHSFNVSMATGNRQLPYGIETGYKNPLENTQACNFLPLCSPCETSPTLKLLIVKSIHGRRAPLSWKEGGPGSHWSNHLWFLHSLPAWMAIFIANLGFRKLILMYTYRTPQSRMVYQIIIFVPSKIGG